MIPKYRAWHKKEKKMYDVIRIDFFYEEVDINPPHLGTTYSKKPAKFEDVILIQSTGLNDKNDNEVFEGDIIRTPKGKIYVVEYKINDSVYWWYGDVVLRLCEKIGNIYENPELLKETD